MSQLSKAVLAAIKGSLVEVEPKLWISDPSRFAQTLRRLWLYNDNRPTNIDLCDGSGPFFFLLYKSLSVTNLSAIEAAALVRQHARDRRRRKHHTAQFCSGADFAAFVTNAWSAYTHHLRPALKKQAIEDLNAVSEAFVRAHELLFGTTCVLEYYFTSFLLAVPPTLTVDVAAIVAESGYIHSGGPVVYARNIQKADIEELEARIKIYLTAEQDRKIYVVPYAEEFFSPYDDKTPVSLRNGLNNVKLKLRKHFIEDTPLLEYLTTLHGKRFNGALYVPKGLADFKTERSETTEPGAPIDKRCTKTCTLWFVTDANFALSDAGVPYRGEQSYLFVYAQYVKNDSQLITYKERKPGWYASITLPHTMSIAAANVLRRKRTTRSKRPLVIVDPFCGTGTSLMDLALRFDGAAIVGLDRSKMSVQAVRDNIAFFCRSSAEVSRLERLAANIFEELRNPASRWLPVLEIAEQSRRILEDEAAPLDPQHVYERAVALLLEEFARQGPDTVAGIKAILDTEFSAEFQNTLRSPLFAELDARIMFYFLWRACANGLFVLRDTADIKAIFIQELETCLRELRYLISRLARPALRPVGWGHELCEGAYSRDTRVNRETLKLIEKSIAVHSETEFNAMIEADDFKPGLHLINVADSIDTLMRMDRQADIILTDPPYGFNTAEGGESVLKEFFERLPRALVRATAQAGEIALVLPEFARNGRQIPFFETKDSMVRQMLAHAHAAGRLCTDVSETTSGPPQLSRFPARWASATVLERSVLKFRIV